MNLPPEISSLLLPEIIPSEWDYVNRPVARWVRGRLKELGQTRKDLHQLMQWSKNTTKAYRYLDELLAGEIPNELEPAHDAFTRRALEVLDATPLEIVKLLARDIQFLDERATFRMRHQRHTHYRKEGPTLQFLCRDTSLHRRAPKFIISPIKLSPTNPIPPTAQEMSHMIAEFGILGLVDHLGSFKLAGYHASATTLDQSNSTVQHFAKPTTPGKWRYHRLPDEIHEFHKNGQPLNDPRLRI